MALLFLGLFLTIPLTAAWQVGPDFSNNFGRPGADTTFDYVVIGAGPAGITLATRLAEHENVTVALVEAGGFYEVEASNLTVVPAYYSGNVGGPLVDWHFQTIPQPQLQDQTAAYPRGKTLGGSSALNAMLYHRGTVQSHQQWADAVDDQSYSWDAFLPYYKKSVTYTTPKKHLRAANASVPQPSREAYQSDGGPLHVTHSNWATPWASWAQKGFREIGIVDIDDFSSGQLVGSQYCPLTIRPEDQTRATSESTFLQNAMQSDRRNLKIFTHSMAKQVLFDGNKTATGVVVETGGFNYTLSANKEIILSAGAFQSPQLLMVSGVGPEEILRKHDIPVVSARPGVGQNMWDHVLFGVVYEANLSTIAVLQDRDVAAEYASQYLANATGILTSQNTDYLGWEKLPAESRRNLSSAALAALAEFPPDWPEIEYVVGSFSIWPELDPSKNYITILPALVTPLSRGSVSIASSNMKDAPLIDAGWLSNSTDVDVLVQALKRARALFESSAVRPILVGDEALPGQDVVTDAQMADYIRSYATTVYHASCTCKMGKTNDPMAVVDSKARVHGVQGLRVVDASAFPLLIPGHPQSVVYALAEKIADDIITMA